MTIDDHIAELDQRLKKVAPAIASLADEIEAMINSRIEALVAQNDEGARGGVKALRELLELPSSLYAERAQLDAGLPDRDPDFS